VLEQKENIVAYTGGGMATLEELRKWEEQAKGYWLDSLLAVHEMLNMHADDPERGCLKALREAQDVALQAGRRVRELQERIARLEGPGAVFGTLKGFRWPDNPAHQH
jgi:hypothetical protein